MKRPEKNEGNARRPSRATRHVKESQVEMTEIVFPNDANALGTLHGGKLMLWLDIAASVAASRHCNRIAVTASVDELNFLHPINIGEVVILRASVNRVFHTSMEVGVKVMSEDLLTGEVKHANSAYLTFVAIDKRRRPVPCPPIVPETPEEIRRYEEALRRRQMRLDHRGEV
jgi:acyl-CoA hydrolase